MVSTRHHPRSFPEPTSIPSSSSNGALSPVKRSAKSPTPAPKKPSTSTALSRRSASSSSSASTWSHTPALLILLWLAVSLPLVIWDTGYILLRPHTMPGGRLHKPIWSPYELYGTVDYVYGQPAWDKGDGFGGAQGAVNAMETLGYLYYLWLLFVYGKDVEGKRGRGAPKRAEKSEVGFVRRLVRPRSLGGETGAQAVLLLFAVSVMTVSKTVLYWLNEYFSDFAHIGHNTPMRLLFLWIIPNGAWLVVPTFMIYVSAKEIIQGLTLASGKRKDI